MPGLRASSVVPASLHRLEQALGRAGEGTPTTVLLGGDAGVGKTRLIEEFTEHARRQSARVLTGGVSSWGTSGCPTVR